MKSPASRAYSYVRNGAIVCVQLPKRNHRKPKTKRLRKKRFWLKCADCNQWFLPYTKGYGVTLDGKNVCSQCKKERFRIERPDLFLML